MPKAEQIVTIDIRGVPELRRRFMLLGTKIEDKVMRGALYAGVVIIRDEAKRHVPVRFGLLKKSIKAVSSVPKSQGPSGGLVVAKVTIERKKYSAAGFTLKGKAKFKGQKYVIKKHNGRGIGDVQGYIVPKLYAHLVEYGTAPHAIGKGSERVLRSGKNVIGPGFQHGAMHPGAKANPFLRTAWDNKRAEAMAAVLASAKARLATEVLKIGQQPRRMTG